MTPPRSPRGGGQDDTRSNERGAELPSWAGPWREPAFRERLAADPEEAVRGYELTDAERRWLVLPNFGWLLDGEVAGSSRPQSAAALAALHAVGCGWCVNLGEQPLLKDGSGRRPAGDGATRPRLRRPDLGPAGRRRPPPSSRPAPLGEPVAVCCGAGLGRTGTVLAAVLVRRGLPAREAIHEVRAQRPGSIETPEQEAVGRRLRARPAPRRGRASPPTHARPAIAPGRDPHRERERLTTGTRPSAWAVGAAVERGPSGQTISFTATLASARKAAMASAVGRLPLTRGRPGGELFPIGTPSGSDDPARGRAPRARQPPLLVSESRRCFWRRVTSSASRRAPARAAGAGRLAWPPPRRYVTQLAGLASEAPVGQDVEARPPARAGACAPSERGAACVTTMYPVRSGPRRPAGEAWAVRFSRALKGPKVTSCDVHPILGGRSGDDAGEDRAEEVAPQLLRRDARRRRRRSAAARPRRRRASGRAEAGAVAERRRLVREQLRSRVAVADPPVAAQWPARRR